MASITISSVTVPNWQGATSGISLLIYNNASFTAATGTLYPQTISCHLTFSGFTNVGTFFQANGCTVSGGSLVIPAITLDSTEDSPDNPTATYSAVLWDGNSGQPIQPFGTFSSFALAASPTSITWAEIFALAADQ